MSFQTRLKTAAAGMLLLGALFVGAPMRPEEIEELLAQIQTPKVVHTLRQEEEEDEP